MTRGAGDTDIAPPGCRPTASFPFVCPNLEAVRGSGGIEMQTLGQDHTPGGSLPFFLTLLREKVYLPLILKNWP
jgi:hypothetical protein